VSRVKHGPRQSNVYGRRADTMNMLTPAGVEASSRCLFASSICRCAASEVNPPM